MYIDKNKAEDFSITIPNASNKKGYEEIIRIPWIEGMEDIELIGLNEEEHGLKIEPLEEEKGAFKISGVPKQAGEFPLTLSYHKKMVKDLKITINPDPKDLWKDIPFPDDSEYYKTNTESDFTKINPLQEGDTPKNIIVASRRGRSHAHEGKSRDDHFKIHYDENTHWYIMAVADGAGSAEYSREGSKIACETSVECIKKELLNSKSLEENIGLWKRCPDDEKSSNNMISTEIYNIIGKASYEALKAIDKEAKNKSRSLKVYSTTLLLSICKKFKFGWFIASFWVGDGAICLYDEKNRTAKLLGKPDEGEYGGQTYFLTMPEIFSNVSKRLRFTIVPDFTALFMMTDGVSDPKFETTSNLENPEKWKELWENLTTDTEHPVDLSNDNKEEVSKQLLEWLNFWAVGNHDDRTIAILY